MISSKSQVKSYTSNDLENSSQSLLMQDIYRKILTLAQMDSNIILVGEIGLGKKHLSQIIHKNSKRSNGPFYSFYCIDLDEREYKDAFWGHLKFEENQVKLKYEALEKAEGGTLYLDQYSELSVVQMINLLDSYQKGCNQLFRYDKKGKPRLIISMNQESYSGILHQPIWDKLLNHLDPVVIMLPPLRERKEDIPVLIDRFMDEIKDNYTEFVDLEISTKALCKCINYNWPGNIRQLKNAILQGAILSYGQKIKAKHLPFSMSWELPYEMAVKDFN